MKTLKHFEFTVLAELVCDGETRPRRWNGCIDAEDSSTAKSQVLVLVHEIVCEIGGLLLRTPSVNIYPKSSGQQDPVPTSPKRSNRFVGWAKCSVVALGAMTRGVLISILRSPACGWRAAVRIWRRLRAAEKAELIARATVVWLVFMAILIEHLRIP